MVKVPLTKFRNEKRNFWKDAYLLRHQTQYLQLRSIHITLMLCN